MAIVRDRRELPLRKRLIWWLTSRASSRIQEEEDIYVAVDARTESLQSLRELGPPDLVYLVKQPKANSTRQVSLHCYVFHSSRSCAGN